jgi:Helix-turn-helix.
MWIYFYLFLPAHERELCINLYNIQMASQTMNLKSIRKKLKTPRPTLTRIANLAGLPVSTLNNIITGIRKASPETEDKIVTAYGQAWEELK